MSYLLMVDDDRDFCEATATALRKHGHEVDIVLTTDGAAEIMEDRPPDLVILDVMFPEDRSAGFHLAREMKRGSQILKSIPIIVLTALNTVFPMGFSSNDIDGTWLPVSDFVEKPVELEILLAKVSALLAGPRPAGSGGL